MKTRQSKLLRQAQFLLAVFCRAENNNLYLNCQVELRPGYLAKWIEINFIPINNENPDIITYMKKRWQRQTIDNESARRHGAFDPQLASEQAMAMGRSN
jgi:hypothetical protein